jgi:RNA polymerase sigma-70 factor (ECF subfamily)
MTDKGGPDRYASGFETLYEATSRQVLAFALRRTVREADAEDAVAETYVVAWRRLADAPATPLPWLYGICRRVLANQRRSSDRRGRLNLRIFGHAPSEPADLRMEGGPAMQALAALRDEDRELLRLVAWEDLDHAAIAKVLDISVNAVAIRLHRARARFSDEFSRLASQLKDSTPSRTSDLAMGRTTGSKSEDAG